MPDSDAPSAGRHGLASTLAPIDREKEGNEGGRLTSGGTVGSSFP